MKIKNLLPIIAVAAITQGAFAAEIDAVTLSHDGRILRAQGAPAAVQVVAFSSTAPDSVPATCKAFDMAGFLNRDDAKPALPVVEGVPYGSRLVSAWHEAAGIVGRTPDSMFFCMTKDGERMFGEGTSFNPSYEYRKAAGAAPERGQIVSVIGGSVVIGVVFWNPVMPVAESKYVSMNFGR